MQLFHHLVHLIIALILTVTTIILYAMAQGNEGSALYKDERRFLYTYEPRKIDLAVAEELLTKSWIDNDKAGALGTPGYLCNTPSIFGVPKASFDSEGDAKKCPITFTVTGEPGGYPVITRNNTASASKDNCPTNTGVGHSIMLTGDGVTVDSGVKMQVDLASNTVVLSLTNNGVSNVKFTNNDQTCTQVRATLVEKLHNSTSCYTEGSQFCSCVRLFTGYLTSNRAQNALKTPSSKDKVPKLSAAILNGMKKCAELRRHNDVRTTQTSSPLKVSFTLMLFSLGLFFNAIYVFISKNNILGVKEANLGHTFLFLMLFLLCMVANIAIGFMGGGGAIEAILTMAIGLPAMFLGLFMEYPEWLGWEIFSKQMDRPMLHPAFFDLALQALTVFSLVSRGIVQYEVIIFEIFKAHAVAFIYAVIVWYNLHPQTEDGASRNLEKDHPFKSVYIQEAYLVLFSIGVAASMDSILIPYPSEDTSFRVMRLLPALLVLFCFLNRAWVSTLRLSTITGVSQNDYLSTVTGGCLLLIWMFFLSWFMDRHLRLYNSVPANGSPWPTIQEMGLKGVLPTLPTLPTTTLMGLSA